MSEKCPYKLCAFLLPFYFLFLRYNLCMKATPLLLKVLQKSAYFSDLPVQVLVELASTAVKKTYAPKEPVFWEGDDSAGLYILTKGWLKVVKISAKGREQVLHFLKVGETFNALSVFTDIPNPATVIALEDSEVWLIRRETMNRLLEQNTGMARQVIAELASRLVQMLQLVEDISLYTVEARLARYLVEQASANTVSRQHWATQTEMAARLGTVPDVVSRVLRKFVDAELIEVARHEIRILDIARLQARAEQS